MDQKSYIEFKNKHLTTLNVYYIENNKEIDFISENDIEKVIKNLNFKNVLWSQYYGHGRSNRDWHYKNALGDTNFNVNTIMSTGQKNLFFPRYKSGHIMVHDYVLNYIYQNLDYPVFFNPFQI